jgi:hypothetical protein
MLDLLHCPAIFDESESKAGEERDSRAYDGVVQLCEMMELPIEAQRKVRNACEEECCHPEEIAISPIIGRVIGRHDWPIVFRNRYLKHLLYNHRLCV